MDSVWGKIAPFLRAHGGWKRESAAAFVRKIATMSCRGVMSTSMGQLQAEQLILLALFLAKVFLVFKGQFLTHPYKR